MKRTTTVQWWPYDAPIPPGWRLANHAASHHSAHARLIEKCDETSDNDGREPRK